jgi:hypothetical protein
VAVLDALDFLDVAHGRIEMTVTGDTAVAISDSCGSYREYSTGRKQDFGGPESDLWTFRQLSGQWRITSLTFNRTPTETQQVYTFEDDTHGCWLVRIDNDVPQGEKTAPTGEQAHGGQMALRFDFDTAKTQEHRGQVVHINMPFAGQASAWVYAPPGAPADLEAGFFAMELDHQPWDYHEPDQLSRLVPGQWTQITWNVDVTGWKPIPHLLGIEVHRPNKTDYAGYILIDDVRITGR